MTIIGVESRYFGGKGDKTFKTGERAKFLKSHAISRILVASVCSMTSVFLYLSCSCFKLACSIFFCFVSPRNIDPQFQKKLPFLLRKYLVGT